MKTTLITLSIVAFGLGANAQKVKEAEVPSRVKTKVASLYPNTKIEKWENEDGNFEAELEVNKAETSVLLDASGNLLETETEIAVSALPKAVSDYCAKNFTGKKIAEAAKIVDSKNVTTYEAEVKGVGDVIFDASGNFLKKKVEQDDDDDDEKDEKK